MTGVVAWRLRFRGCRPDFPAVASSLTDLGAGMVGLDVCELGDDVFDGRAWGEHGDRLRRWRRRCRGRALEGLVPCLADGVDAFGPSWPGRARTASDMEAVEAVGGPRRTPGRAHAFGVHARCLQRRHLFEVGQTGLVLAGNMPEPSLRGQTAGPSAD